MSLRRLPPKKYDSPYQRQYRCEHVERPKEATTLDEPVLVMLRDSLAELGWSLAVHGSLKRDIDLIAVPWCDDAEPALEVINAISRCGLVIFGGIERKPHGRVAMLWSGATPKVIDLSIVDPRGFR